MCFKKLSKFFFVVCIDVSMNSECQCDSSSAAPIIIGVIIGIIGIAVGIAVGVSGLIVAVIMFKRMR